MNDKDEKDYCEDLYRRWEKLKRDTGARDYIPGENIQNIPSKELLDEMQKNAEKLQKECKEYLSVNEKYEIDDYLKFHQK